MRSRSVLLVSAILALVATEARPCGDKFLTVGRGTRYQRGYVSVHPSSITVLQGKYAANPEFRKKLRTAGHRVEVSADLPALRTNILSGKYTIVLADLSEAPEVESLLTELKTKTAFLPVVDTATDKTSAEALKKYSCVLTPAKDKKKQHFLAVLDGAIEEISAGKEAVCAAPGAK